MTEEKCYNKADFIGEQIEKTKYQLIKRKAQLLVIQQSNEMKQLEEKYISEIKDLNERWDKKIKEFKENAKILEDMLNEKHLNDKHEYIQSLEIVSSKIIMKFSTEYIHLKNAEDNLVKQNK